MTEMSSRGRFVWYDLMTTDPSKAEAFYTKVCGWGTQPWESPTQYTMWTANGTPMGGVMPVQNPGAPPHWLAYIGCPDVDETVKKAESLGGKTFVKSTDIPNVGRFAVLGDPQGAVFSAFASSNPPQPEEDPKVGEFSWHELVTTDYDAGFRFYQTLYGWEKARTTTWDRWACIDCSDATARRLAGCSTSRPRWRRCRPTGCTTSRSTARAPRSIRVKANGGQVLNGPMEVPGGDWIRHSRLDRKERPSPSTRRAADRRGQEPSLGGSSSGLCIKH